MSGLERSDPLHRRRTCLRFPWKTPLVACAHSGVRRLLKPRRMEKRTLLPFPLPLLLLPPNHRPNHRIWSPPSLLQDACLGKGALMGRQEIDNPAEKTGRAAPGLSGVELLEMTGLATELAIGFTTGVTGLRDGKP